jgi:urease accessory protein
MAASCAASRRTCCRWRSGISYFKGGRCFASAYARGFKFKFKCKFKDTLARGRCASGGIVIWKIMDLINAPLAAPAPATREILLPIDRITLAKRRWRGAAADGREFGFDLTAPLRDHMPFFHAAGATYRIAQQPEPVLEIALAGADESARLGWMIGNLHFTLQITDSVIRMPDDSALRQMLDREQIPYTTASRVFHPFRPGHLH